MLDPNIILSGTAPKTPDLLGAVSAISQLKSQQLNQQLVQQEIQQRQAQAQKAQLDQAGVVAANKALQAANGDYSAAGDALIKGGFGELGTTFKQKALELSDLSMKNQTAKLTFGAQQASHISDVLSHATDQPSYAAALATLQNQGIDTSKMSPTYDPAYVAQKIDQGKTIAEKAKEQLNQSEVAKNTQAAAASKAEADTKTAMLPGALANQALTGTELQQKTTGAVPLTAKDRIEAAQKAQELALSRSRLGVEQYNAGLDASGKPVQYQDANGQATNVSPIAKAIGEYRLPPVAARSMATGGGKNLMNQVLAANPSFDIGQYEERYKTMQDLRPAGQLGQKALALNTLIRHTDDAFQAADQLQNGTFTPLNAVSQRIAQLTGKAAPTNFDQLKQYVAGETVALIRKGEGSEADIQAAKENISRAASPEQLKGALQTNLGIAGGKMDAMNTAVRSAIGNDKYTALDPGAAEIMQKRGYDPATLKPKGAQTTAAPKEIQPGDRAAYDALPRGATYTQNGHTYIKK